MTTVSADVIARLAVLPSSAVADALGRTGVVGSALHRLAGVGRFAGRACTIDCRGTAPRSIRPAVEACSNGDVLVIDASGADHVTAHVGELMATELVRRGVVAVVIDGYVRDIDILRAGDLHVYARGVTPLALLAPSPGSVGATLELDGIAIAHGDVIVGDDDGLVAVSAVLAASTADAAEAVVARELDVATRVLAGEALFDVLSAS